MVKEERNHPSIFVWSIENELTLINARNFGLLEAGRAARSRGRPRP